MRWLKSYLIPEISRRVRDKYHNLEHYEVVKIIFNSGKNKAGVGMKIPSWMISDEMKLTENYRMYAEVFGVDVPTTQSQPIESTQGTHRTTSAPSYTQKSRDDLEAHQNVEKVKEHLVAEEIEKMVEGTESEDADEVDNSILNSQNDPGTRLDPRSYKKSPEVEKTAVVQLVNIIEEEDKSAEDDYELRRRVKGKNVEESRNTPSPTPIRSPRIHSTLISSDTKKLQELTVTDPTPLYSTPSSSSSKLSTSKCLLSLFKPETGQVMEESLPNMVDDRVKELTKTQVPIHVAEGLIMERKQNQADVAKMIADVDSSVRNYMSGHILHVHPTQASQASTQEQQYQLYLTMKDNPQLQHDDLRIWLALKIKLKGLTASNTPCRSSAIRPRDQDDPHDDAHLEGENSAKRQKTSEHGTYVFGESSSGQTNESEPGPSTSGNQEQLDVFYFWMDKYATNDDELLAEKNPHVKIFYIKRQKEPGKPKEEVYSNSKIVQVIKTTCELGHEHKFVTKIIARRANGSIMSITEPDYKNLNKNDIEDMYLLCINGKLGVESYQQKVNLTVPTITFSGIEKKKMFSIINEPIYGIIYKNNKKEKKVMGHQEIHKFCDATLKRVLEGLKSYNNDVKHGYVTPSLSKEDAEYLQLFEE
ncbi:hypothetical protein Tco_1157015 [Tanacetum coccineum]